MYSPQPPQPSPPHDPAWPYPPTTDTTDTNSSDVPPPPYTAPSSLPELGYTGEKRADGNWLRIPLAKPVLTPIILATLVGIFVLMALSPEINVLFRGQGAKLGFPIYQGEWWRLVTATFLHDGLLHILFNGYALYAIGMDLEAFMGRARFAAIYVIAGLAGSVSSFIFSPFNIPGVGASGAIFGLIGALGVYFGLHRRLFGKMGQAQFWNIIVVIALNVGLGFSGIFPIDNSAHLGGLLAGAVVGYVLCPRYVLGEWSAPNMREIVNVNKSTLSWVAAGLIGLIVIGVFLVALLLIKANIFVPSIYQG